MARFPRKTMLAAALYLAAMAAMEWIPGLDWHRAPSAATLSAILRNPPPSPPRAEPPPDPAPKPKEPTAGPMRPPVEVPRRPDFVSAPGKPRITDPAGSLAPFFAAMRRAEERQPGAVVRVLHYGDSPTTADSITGDVRLLLQRRFGDAGHGFLLIAKPWAWYGHHGVGLKAEGWIAEPSSHIGRARDSLHGLGGVNFIGYFGAYSQVTLPGAPATRVEIHSLRPPGGGELKVEAGGRQVVTESSAGAEKSPGYASGEVAGGADSFKLTVTRGGVRLYGWNFENDGPGVVYSSIGLNGASVQTLVNYFDEKQWGDQLRRGKPALVVLNYGSNESVSKDYVEKYYTGELRKLAARVRSALPDTPILIMSPMDRGERDKTGGIATVPTVPRIVEIQRQVALETGSAFFDTFAAMGGSGTMAQWYAATPRLVSADFLHPTPGGAARVGALLEQALLESYGRWKAAQ